MTNKIVNISIRFNSWFCLAHMIAIQWKQVILMKITIYQNGKDGKAVELRARFFTHYSGIRMVGTECSE